MRKSTKIASATIGMALLAGSIFPACAPATYAAALSRAAEKAQDTAGTDSNKIANMKSRADREIDRRIAALTTLSARIQSIKKVTDTQKANLKASIDGQITVLKDLKTEIDASTDLTALKSKVESITKSYRTFALVIPQGTVIAAADRALAIADNMTTLGTKLQMRISEAKTSGKDTAALEKFIADYNAKIADAKTQAQSAIDKVSNLAPDGGDKTKMAANLAALKDAKAKIQTAQQDFVSARKDAAQIAQGLKTLARTKAADSSANAE